MRHPRRQPLRAVRRILRQTVPQCHQCLRPKHLHLPPRILLGLRAPSPASRLTHRQRSRPQPSNRRRGLIL
jgi:hypothetical protein